MRRAMQPWSNQFLVALRAKKFDVWATNFLGRHPDAVVLHLGCGLDSRAFRLDPPAGVRWFDVDVPNVIDLRRKLYDEHDGYRMIGSSVTEAAWLDHVPADGPALVVAEGLLMYITEAEVRQLLQRITDKFGSGELAFDVLPRWSPWLSKLFTHGIGKWGTRDARELETWNPRLRFLEENSAIAGCDEIPLKPQRLLHRALYALPVVRNYDRLYRFAF
jgi:O-methyltransferase involved in polyketide biosynthesis